MPDDFVTPGGSTLSGREAEIRRAAGTLDGDGVAEDDFVVVDGQTLSRREAAIREAAGTGGVVETAGARARGVLADIREEEFGGVLGGAEAAAQGAARALTFGGSDLALEALGQEEILQTLRQVNPGAALAGEISGAVLSLAAGGPGVGARILSLTPRGAMAAKGATWVAGAGTTAGKFGRRVAVEALEGGADLASGELVRQLLADQDIDGSEIGAKAARGVLLGAAGGAVGEALGAGLGLAGAALRRSDIPTTPGPGRAYDDARAAVERRITEGVDDIRLSDLANKHTFTRKSFSAHRKLETHVREAAKRKALKEADDVMELPTLRSSLGDSSLAIKTTLRRQAQQVTEAGGVAEAWRRKYQKALGRVNESTYAAKVAKVDPALTRDGAKILAKLDDVTGEFDQTLATLRRADAEGALAIKAAPVSGEVYQTVGERIRAKLGISSFGGTGRLGQAATQIAAGAEAAQAAGVQVPSVSQMLGGGTFGKAVGLMIGARALGSRGIGDAVGTLVPGMSRVVQLAGAANKYRAQIRTAVTRGLVVAQRGSRIAAPKAIKQGAKYDPRKFQAARDVVARDLAEMPGAMGAEAMGAIDRIDAYLAKTEPKQPNPGSPFFDDWKPDPVSQDAWDRRTSTAADASWAIARIFASPQSTIEVEALRACHPGVYTEIQSQLQLVAQDLAQIEKLSVPMRSSLSLGFGVALLPQYLPGYGFAPPTASPKPEPRFARPSTASASPLVRGETVRGPGRKSA